MRTYIITVKVDKLAHHTVVMYYRTDNYDSIFDEVKRTLQRHNYYTEDIITIGVYPILDTLADSQMIVLN